MVHNRLIFNKVSLGVHETDLPDEAGILRIKAGEQRDDQAYLRFDSVLRSVNRAQLKSHARWVPAVLKHKISFKTRALSLVSRINYVSHR
jgi:hypothetical protein